MSRNPLPRTPDLCGSDVEKTRREIREYFHSTFDIYEQLFETLADDDSWYRKPIPLRHPLIFYFGHTASFFVNKLLPAGLMKERIDPGFESIFAVGVDEMSWDDLCDANYDWPQVFAVRRYRDRVREAVDSIIAEAPLALPIDWDNPWWAILMGIEHELIHLETSSVLIRQHSLERVKSHPNWLPCEKSAAAPPNELVTIPAGTVILGKEKSDRFYGWDNEYGCQQTDVAEFQASRFLVSNGEFHDFVAAGGYRANEFWDEEGSAWKNYAGALHPAFWVKKESEWSLRLLTQEVAMPWDWPVEVNCHEARAFCRWKSRESAAPLRLPSEDEWRRMLDFSGIPADSNLHLDHYASSCPVNEFRQGELYDVTGNVWQWTETPIHPFPGFAVHKLYDDFTTPTFDGRHNIFKGGSWISCGNESRSESRYAFRRHFFQHAGFRYVQSKATVSVPQSNYETDKLLSEYAEFHYGEEYFGVANFPQALAELAASVMADKPRVRALDLGCAAGRATFELARHFDSVTGIDFSARFIGLGVALKENGILRYTLPEEGELVSYKEAVLGDLAAVKERVEFFQGDACNLKPVFADYDLILAANLIDRLYDPQKFLHSVQRLLKMGGILLIASPYSWTPEHTPREKWLGGFKKNGENYRTRDALEDILGKNFRLLGEPTEIPFVIRETRRKFQHSLSEVTIWERNA